jgi:hypothetical protein
MHNFLNQIWNSLSEASRPQFLTPLFPRSGRGAVPTHLPHNMINMAATSYDVKTINVGNFLTYNGLLVTSTEAIVKTYFTKSVKPLGIKLTNSLNNIYYNLYKRAQTFCICTTKNFLGSLKKGMYCHLPRITETHQTKKLDPSLAAASTMDLSYI